MIALTEEQQERIDLIRHKLKFIEQKPTVACIEILQPLMLADSNLAELVSIAGGNLLLAEAGNVEWETIQQQNPDIIIIMPRRFAIERTMKYIDVLLQLPGFNELKAVKNSHLYIADGSRHFYDSNIVESVELLAEIINPKQFVFGYEGDGWVRFEV